MKGAIDLAHTQRRGVLNVCVNNHDACKGEGGFKGSKTCVGTKSKPQNKFL